MEMKYQLVLLLAEDEKWYSVPALGGGDGGLTVAKNLTEQFEKMWEEYFPDTQAPRIQWSESGQHLDNGYTLKLISKRVDVVQIKTVDGSTVTVSHEEIINSLGNIVNHDQNAKLHWNLLHSTLIANVLRSLNSFCVRHRPNDGRLPQFIREEQSIPFV